MAHTDFFCFRAFIASMTMALNHVVCQPALHVVGETSSAKLMDIPLDMDINSPVGIPITSKRTATRFCIFEGTMELELLPFDTLEIKFWLKKDTLHMACINTITQYSIEGQFYVPPLPGVNFSVLYDPETFEGVLQPYQYYMPIRTGVWSFGSPQKGYKTKTYNSIYKNEFYDINCAGKKPGRVLKP